MSLEIHGSKAQRGVYSAGSGGSSMAPSQVQPESVTSAVTASAAASRLASTDASVAGAGVEEHAASARQSGRVSRRISAEWTLATRLASTARR
jgi:hypothetical protein